MNSGLWSNLVRKRATTPTVYFPAEKESMYEKKSHTCEEGGAHLRISVWHLLMTLKNNYLLKKLLKWANIKCKNFNIYNAVFFKKYKEKYLEISYLCTKNPDDMTYSY